MDAPIREGLTDAERASLYRIRETARGDNRITQAKAYRDDVTCLLDIIARLDGVLYQRGVDAETPKNALAAAIHAVLVEHGCHNDPTG